MHPRFIVRPCQRIKPKQMIRDLEASIARYKVGGENMPHGLRYDPKIFVSIDEVPPRISSVSPDRAPSPV